MYQVLSKKVIRHWLSQLVKKGDESSKGGKTRRDGPTLNGISNYTGIPRNTLRFFAREDDRAQMGEPLQRLLSKTIALIDNGQLTFERGKGLGRPTIAVISDRPKPRPRFVVSVTPTGPKLRIADRPPPVPVMPSFKDILLK